MNKYNIEVGDIVRGAHDHSGDDNTNGKVVGVFKGGISYTNNNPGYRVIDENTWDIVNTKIESKAYIHIKPKMNKGKLIGYKLLKDTPEYDKGEIFVKSTKFREDGDYEYQPKSSLDTEDEGMYYYGKSKVENRLDWFEPVYASAEVTVKISKSREVKLVDKKVLFEGDLKGEGASFAEVEGIYKMLNTSTLVSTKVKVYPFEILTFKIGCQEFSKKDIELVYKAIQDNK